MWYRYIEQLRDSSQVELEEQTGNDYSFVSPEQVEMEVASRSDSQDHSEVQDESRRYPSRVRRPPDRYS